MWHASHYPQVYCTTTSCPCRDFIKILKVHFELSGNPWYGEKKFIYGPLLSWTTQVSNLLGVGRGPQIYKNRTNNGGDNWGWCCKNWQEHSFVSDNAREVRRKSACLYQKLMCSFSIIFSLSFSYAPYSASIYPVPKFCTASSGRISCFPNTSLYIIAYYYQASQSYIGIIDHGGNWFWPHGISDRQTTLRSGINCFIFIFLKQILW